MTTCDHTLGSLPCVNAEDHEGAGKGCVHHSATGSWVDDTHQGGGHE